MVVQGEKRIMMKLVWEALKKLVRGYCEDPEDWIHS